MKNIIRVAMISHNYYPYIGGAEHALAALNPVLQTLGVDIYVLTRRTSGTQSFEQVAGVPVYRLPVSISRVYTSLTFTLKALQILYRQRPDIVHAHIMFSPATIAVIAKYLFGTPVIATIQRGGPAPLGEVARLRQKFLGEQRLWMFRRQIDRFIALSREIQEELVTAGIPAEHCVLLPNAVDIRHFTPLSSQDKQVLRHKLNIPGEPVVIYAGRLMPEKRVKHLLTVWPAVRRLYPKAILLIVGDGPETSFLQQMAGDGVQFTGGVNDVQPYLQAADLFVLPSIAEGLSVASLEAMAVGLPIIITKLAGALDLITHGENGWFIPPDDIPALQKAIFKLLANPAIRADIGRKGREYVKRDYDLPVIAGRLRILYEQLMAEKHQRTS